MARATPAAAALCSIRPPTVAPSWSTSSWSASAPGSATPASRASSVNSPRVHALAATRAGLHDTAVVYGSGVAVLGAVALLAQRRRA